jgi:NTP pyrophosphatase (non-canonical NTP hydrolase)
MNIEEQTRIFSANSKFWFPGLYSDNGPNLKMYFGLALGGEVGELENFIKKEIRGDGRRQKWSRIPIGLEMVDILIYLLLLAKEYEINIEDFIPIKTRILYERWGIPQSTLIKEMPEYE